MVTNEARGSLVNAQSCHEQAHKREATFISCVSASEAADGSCFYYRLCTENFLGERERERSIERRTGIPKRAQAIGNNDTTK
jgi:hypothetical protein